jgi:NMD protein affecting ribosome stability and mRNA decay
MPNFTGKCSRCEILKADFEEIPTAFDVLLCNHCYNQITKDATRDNSILLLLEDIENLKSRLKSMLS